MSNTMSPNEIFVITGPSGCGKSTLVRSVLKEIPGTFFSVSHTTRPRRKSEIQGKDYYFTGAEAFRLMIEKGELAEWAEVHGHLYGTSRGEIEEKTRKGDLLLDIDVQGASQIRKKYDGALFVFIIPPSFQELQKRLQKRGEDDAAAVRQRLQTARREIRRFAEFDYIVINNNVKEAVRELTAVIVSRRCALENRKEEVLSIMATFEERE